MERINQPPGTSPRHIRTACFAYGRVDSLSPNALLAIPLPYVESYATATSTPLLPQTHNLKPSSALKPHLTKTCSTLDNVIRHMYRHWLQTSRNDTRETLGVGYPR